MLRVGFRIRPVSEGETQGLWGSFGRAYFDPFMGKDEGEAWEYVLLLPPNVLSITFTLFFKPMILFKNGRNVI